MKTKVVCVLLVISVIIVASAKTNFAANSAISRALISVLHKISDADGDTYITTEPTPDADEIVAFVGGTEAMRIHSSGIIDMPKQSLVIAYRNGAQSITQETETDVIFNSELYDIQSEYNTTTGEFTATEAGFYHYDATVRFAAATLNRAYLVLVVDDGAGYGHVRWG